MFVDKAFKFQPNVCNACNDVLMMSINLNDIAFLNICDNEYHCIINELNKSDTINLLQNENLNKEADVSWDYKLLVFLKQVNVKKSFKKCQKWLILMKNIFIF